MSSTSRNIIRLRKLSGMTQDDFKLNYSDPETKKEPAQLELERVREISGWLPRGGDMRTAGLALVDGNVLVRLPRAA